MFQKGRKQVVHDLEEGLNLIIPSSWATEMSAGVSGSFCCFILYRQVGICMCAQ